MQVPVYNITGEVVEHIELRDDIFGVPANKAVVHQALVRQLANARQGTADTKTRGDVSGGGKKPYAQKHTGRARRGSSRSPLIRGGGVVFGPHPRSYRQDMPKKMRRLALSCVLSAKVADSDLKVVQGLAFEQPKTKEMAGIVKALGIDSTALIVTDGADTNVYKSARNLPGIKSRPATRRNVGDLLSHKALMITGAAARRGEETWGPRGREAS